MLRLLSVVTLSVAFLVASTGTARAATYYVRSDGGSASQCSGLADAPYPGSGSSLACAWNHPFQALPPLGPSRIAGGDTLTIAPASYRIGVGAPGAEACDSGGPWDCRMGNPPSGTSAATPTRIVGSGWDSGCASKPELWGHERVDSVLRVENRSFVEFACLEITDHSACIENHCHDAACPRDPGNPLLPHPSVNACQRDTPPYGSWASSGLYAADADHITLRDLDIHGLGNNGILSGRLSEWTLQRVRIVGNGAGGWNGDIGANSSNSGAMQLRNVEIAWNGCGELYPARTPYGCWGQLTGGYGDGLGMGTSGGDWLVEDGLVHHNTSDGLDFLYLDANATLTVRRLRAYANAGNALKLAASGRIENSLLVGDCAYFENWPLMLADDQCRAAGAALATDHHPGDVVELLHSTISGEGDCLVNTECTLGGCNGSERLRARNSLFLGQVDWRQPWERACLVYLDPQMPAVVLDFDYNLEWQVKDNECPGLNDRCMAPGISNPSMDNFDAYPRPGSPLIDYSTALFALNHDLLGRARPQGAAAELGAYEFVPNDTLFFHGFE